MPITAWRTVPYPTSSAPLDPMPSASPLLERPRDLVRAATIVAGDDGGDALHQVVDVRSPLRVVARQVLQGVRVRIDESWRDDQPAGVDRPFAL